MKNRVVITGLGAVTPIGNNINDFWTNTKKGVCGIDYIKAFNTEDLKVKIAAELKEFNKDGKLNRRQEVRMDRFTQFAMVAADEAIIDSKVDLDKIDSTRFGIMVSSAIGGISTIERESENLLTKGTNLVSPYFIPMCLINMAASNIAIKYNARGITNSCVTACAAGTTTIGEAFRTIKGGFADIMIVGSSEAPITPLILSGFTNLGALNETNDPTMASIPFDKRRTGFVVGEGCGILILENLEHALSRNAKIYAEIVGYGASCDAYHVTSPDVDAEGICSSITNALKEAEIKPEDISYINAHGTSTVLNDKYETLGMKKVFGENAYNIPISSTKSMIGHLLGASGAVEAVVCCKALQANFIPATINYKEKDEDCDLDYVPNVGRNKELKYVLSNSMGFGGHNASLIFKKWENK